MTVTLTADLWPMWPITDHSIDPWPAQSITDGDGYILHRDVGDTRSRNLLPQTRTE